MRLAIFSDVAAFRVLRYSAHRQQPTLNIHINVLEHREVEACYFYAHIPKKASVETQRHCCRHQGAVGGDDARALRSTGLQRVFSRSWCPSPFRLAQCRMIFSPGTSTFRQVLFRCYQ